MKIAISLTLALFATCFAQALDRDGPFAPGVDRQQEASPLDAVRAGMKRLKIGMSHDEVFKLIPARRLQGYGIWSSGGTFMPFGIGRDYSLVLYFDIVNDEMVLHSAELKQGDRVIAEVPAQR